MYFAIKRHLSFYLQVQNKKIVAKTLLHIYYLSSIITLEKGDCTAAPHSLAWGADDEGSNLYNEEDIGD